MRCRLWKGCRGSFWEDMASSSLLQGTHHRTQLSLSARPVVPVVYQREKSAEQGEGKGRKSEKQQCNHQGQKKRRCSMAAPFSPWRACASIGVYSKRTKAHGALTLEQRSSPGRDDGCNPHQLPVCVWVRERSWEGRSMEKG